ncbi:MAG: hypothetical protein HY826_09900 [Actinobacteria bacterium]|nr:hypothetical protein [Actinomycetota bacterium]
MRPSSFYVAQIVGGEDLSHPNGSCPEAIDLVEYNPTPALQHGPLIELSNTKKGFSTIESISIVVDSLEPAPSTGTIVGCAAGGQGAEAIFTLWATLDSDGNLQQDLLSEMGDVMSSRSLVLAEGESNLVKVRLNVHLSNMIVRWHVLVRARSSAGESYEISIFDSDGDSFVLVDDSTLPSVLWSPESEVWGVRI